MIRPNSKANSTADYSQRYNKLSDEEKDDLMRENIGIGRTPASEYSTYEQLSSYHKEAVDSYFNRVGKGFRSSDLPESVKERIMRGQTDPQSKSSMSYYFNNDYLFKNNMGRLEVVNLKEKKTSYLGSNGSGNVLDSIKTTKAYAKGGNVMKINAAVSYLDDIDIEIGNAMGFKTVTDFSEFIEEHDDKYYQLLRMLGYNHDNNPDKIIKGGKTESEIVELASNKLKTLMAKGGVLKGDFVHQLTHSGWQKTRIKKVGGDKVYLENGNIYTKRQFEEAKSSYGGIRHAKGEIKERKWIGENTYNESRITNNVKAALDAKRAKIKQRKSKKK